MREALRELELLRLVVSEPFRGARVREVSDRRAGRDLPGAGGAGGGRRARGARRVLAGDVDALRTEIDGMRAGGQAGDVHEFIAHDVAFHRVIVEASGNRTLQDLWRSLHVDLRTTITLIKHVEDLAEVAESHVAVMEALEAGDRELAATRAAPPHRVVRRLGPAAGEGG